MCRRACFYLMSLLAAMALLVGCKSSRKAAVGETPQEKSRKDLFQSLEANAFRYETMTARLNMTLRLPGKELSSRVDLRLARDSALQLSVQPFLGVELFRVELTTDSVRILDRINKRYLVENYADFLTQIQGPNYYNFQALFTNHLFLLGKREVGPADYRSFELTREGASAELVAKGPHGVVSTFGIDRDETIRSTTVADASGNYALSWDYDDFREVGNQIFPMLMRAELVKEGESLGGLDIRYSRIKLDEPVSWDFSIPAKYTRVTMAELLKMIGNLSR